MSEKSSRLFLDNPCNNNSVFGMDQAVLAPPSSSTWSCWHRNNCVGGCFGTQSLVPRKKRFPSGAGLATLGRPTSVHCSVEHYCESRTPTYFSYQQCFASVNRNNTTFYSVPFICDCAPVQLASSLVLSDQSKLITIK